MLNLDDLFMVQMFPLQTGRNSLWTDSLDVILVAHDSFRLDFKHEASIFSEALDVTEAAHESSFELWLCCNGS